MANANGAGTPAEEVQRLVEQLSALLSPDQVVELRAVGVRRGGRPHVESGFFDQDHLVEMVEAALRLTRAARGVYYTLNPLAPDLLARRANRIDWAGEGELARDKDVLVRRWLLVDADPAHDPQVSATDAEKAAALATSFAVREFLRGEGWPEPVLADSGNGYHLLYRIDHPSDDGGLVAGVLRALADRFDTNEVKIDRQVFNPARLCKVPGTLARKGDHTPTRSHRQAGLLEIPAHE